MKLFWIKWCHIADTWDKSKTVPNSNLFVEGYKHNTCVMVCIEHFQQEYVDKRTNWYRGAAPGFILNNNGQEGKHRWLKAKGTHRKNMPLTSYSKCMESYLSLESLRVNPTHTSYRPFVKQPSMEHGDDARTWG